jgi:hypothetical protein
MRLSYRVNKLEQANGGGFLIAFYTETFRGNLAVLNVSTVQPNKQDITFFQSKGETGDAFLQRVRQEAAQAWRAENVVLLEADAVKL